MDIIDKFILRFPEDLDVIINALLVSVGARKRALIGIDSKDEMTYLESIPDISITGLKPGNFWIHRSGDDLEDVDDVDEVNHMKRGRALDIPEECIESFIDKRDRFPITIGIGVKYKESWGSISGFLFPSIQQQKYIEYTVNLIGTYQSFLRQNDINIHMDYHILEVGERIDF